jgi:hypothetical protein
MSLPLQLVFPGVVHNSSNVSYSDKYKDTEIPFKIASPRPNVIKLQWS